MPVEDHLEKILSSNEGTVAVAVISGDAICADCKDGYDHLDFAGFAGIFDAVHEACGAVAADGIECDDLVLAFDAHNLVVRPLSEGWLIAVTERIRRGPLVRLQLNLRLAVRKVEKSLNEEPLQLPEPVAAQRK